MGVQINGTTGNVIATKGTFSGNVGIAGTLTYEDVTDIDAVGLITARSGIEVGASPGVGASISRQGNAIFSGITTIGSKEVGAGITLSPDGDIFFTGIITGNGSGLSNVGVDTAVVFTDKLQVGDSPELISVGVGSDLKISHAADGDSTIEHSGSGSDLIISSVSPADDVFIKCADDLIVNTSSGAKNSIIARNDGEVELFYNASKKLETTNTGVTVTGTLTATAFSGITTAATSDFVQVSRYTVPGEVSEVEIDFDNTNYTHFKIFVTSQNNAYDSNVYVRFKVGGSYQTGSSYYTGTVKKHQGGFDTSTYGGANQSYGYLIDNVGGDNSTYERWAIIGDINTGTSDGPGFMRYDSYHKGSSADYANTMGIVAYQNFGVLQGIRFYNSSGNLEGGAIYTLYGLK